MASVLPPLLLLLVASSPRGAASLPGPYYPVVRVTPTPRSPLSIFQPYQQECNTASIILTEGERRVIREKNKEGRFSGYHLFVKPQLGFEGFTLTEETMDGRYYDAWFPADSNCFPPDGKWHALWVESKITSTTARAANLLRLGYHIGACRSYCTKPYPLQSLRSLSIVAHGPSRWILEEPPTCSYKFLTNALYPPTFPTCSILPPPPSEATTDTPLPPSEVTTDTPLPPSEATTDASLPPSKTTTDTPLPPSEEYMDTPLPSSEVTTDTPLQPDASNITTDTLTTSGTSSPAGTSLSVAVVTTVVVVLVVQTVVVVLVVVFRRRRLQRQFSYQATSTGEVRFAFQPAAPTHC